MDLLHTSSPKQPGQQVEEQGQKSGELGIQARVEEQESQLEQLEQKFLEYFANHLEQKGYVEEETPQSQPVVVYTTPTAALAKERGPTEHEISRIEGCGAILDFLPLMGLSLSSPLFDRETDTS